MPVICRDTEPRDKELLFLIFILLFLIELSAVSSTSAFGYQHGPNMLERRRSPDYSERGRTTQTLGDA